MRPSQKPVYAKSILSNLLLLLVLFGSLTIFGFATKPIAVYAAVCPDGGQAPDGDVINCPGGAKLACERSGGTWATNQDRGTTVTTCENCPSGKTTDGTACQSNTTATGPEGSLTQIVVPTTAGKDQCGKGDKAVQVGFNIGCRGEAYPRDNLNPIVDMAFALFRFLSIGVGLVVIGSIIVAGIQYSASRGNPQATEAAIKRISSAIIGLLLYIFMFSIINFIVPGGMFA